MDKIGDFAKQCQVTIRTLRYYDKLGLLVPDRIDSFTGYRYYGPTKLEEMKCIAELKSIGLSLDEILRFYNAKDDAERDKIMEEKRWELVKQAENTMQQIDRLDYFVIKQKGEIKMSIDFNTPFENDESVIGRWEFIATVNKREEFTPNKIFDNQTIYDELYFLPNGQDYWGFAWTKGYIKVFFNDGLMAPYDLARIDGSNYMFVDRPDYGGIWVLKQTDTKHRSKWDISRSDNIDLPFVDDPQVLGQWHTIGYVNKKEDIAAFDPKKNIDTPQYMKGIEFFEGGVMEWEYDNKYKHHWTKGTTMIQYWSNGERGYTTANAYIIREIDGLEYMFFEQKNGDWVWGKKEPFYQVLKRGAPSSMPETNNNMPFENDESMLGHWVMVGTFNTREEFTPGLETYENDTWFKEIYFLPEGKGYWTFAWTKGYIKVNGGDEQTLVPYAEEEINGERYLFASYKNKYDNKYTDENGNEIILNSLWVLKQTDNKTYTVYEIGQWDNIDKPFVDDPAVHGKWVFVDFVNNIKDFNPAKLKNENANFLQCIQFFSDGRVWKTFSNSYIGKHRWTKNFLLEYFNEYTVAPKYEICIINGNDYLFVQWITGDYIWGKLKPSYYVFQRISI